MYSKTLDIFKSEFELIQCLVDPNDDVSNVREGLRKNIFFAVSRSLIEMKHASWHSYRFQETLKLGFSPLYQCQTEAMIMEDEFYFIQQNTNHHHHHWVFFRRRTAFSLDVHPTDPDVSHLSHWRSYFSWVHSHQYWRESFLTDALCRKPDHDQNISLELDHRHSNLMHWDDRSKRGRFRSIDRSNCSIRWRRKSSNEPFVDRVENWAKERVASSDTVEREHHSDEFRRFSPYKFLQIRVQVLSSLPIISQWSVWLRSSHHCSVQTSNRWFHRSER